MDKITLDEFVQKMVSQVEEFKCFYIKKLNKDAAQDDFYPYCEQQSYDEWLEEMLIWDDLTDGEKC
jgi:hypothetical protein